MSIQRTGYLVKCDSCVTSPNCLRSLMLSNHTSAVGVRALLESQGWKVTRRESGKYQTVCPNCTGTRQELVQRLNFNREAWERDLKQLQEVWSRVTKELTTLSW